MKIICNNNHEHGDIFTFTFVQKIYKNMYVSSSFGRSLESLLEYCTSNNPLIDSVKEMYCTHLHVSYISHAFQVGCQGI